ncbi:MAG TPA: potassium-transporting ATPase subunit KdpB [Candidatus Binatia bacterium]|jgi:K+-transporting ATPase ATPase B chain|nr:potassium-transporting ATPase subunit KdpB [Candidatus Binatia bacterium]
MTHKAPSLFDWNIVGPAIGDSFRKLNPRLMVKNPVMFVTMVGAVLTTVGIFTSPADKGFITQLAIWLWFTVLFANFAEAVAEGRGKAQAESLRKARKDTIARRLRDGREERVPAPQLQKGDLVVCEAGDTIPADGEVEEGIASVDESAITGESAPVIRESGGDRSAVTGGTRVISDRIVIRVTQEKGQAFLDRMIAMVEGASRQKTPNEIALTILLAALTFIFLLVCVTLKPFGIYSGVVFSVPVLVALLVCLIPTTIGGLLSAIGISGIDRLIRRNVMATSGRAVEAAGDVDVLLLDKTGTITLGNRMATAFIPAPGIKPERLADAAQLASLADETPEGRSVVVLAKQQFNLRARELAEPQAKFVPFTAQTRMSGVDFYGDGEQPQPAFEPAGHGVPVATLQASRIRHHASRITRSIRKGAAEAMRDYVRQLGGNFPQAVSLSVEEISRAGGTPLVVAEEAEVLGVVQLKDVVKGGIKERFAQLRKMGIRTVMITGDNPLTAAAIAAEAGVDDFIAQATPEAKLKRIRTEQASGHLVAMTGDGTNDAPALAQADVGVAMNTGTQAAREAGNMVDLDSNPTKLIEIVEIGKQLLITRGSLTTFSIANDVAKYFAIVPAMLMATFPAIAPLNIMHLHNSTSAILSAVIFNALIIIALIPLALRGVVYKPIGALAILQRNLLIYGLGGVIVPFIGIKLIDVIITALRLV